MEKTPPKKPGLLPWALFGIGPGPGQADKSWVDKKLKRKKSEAPKWITSGKSFLERQKEIEEKKANKGKKPGEGGEKPK